jgi:hypothetical protein
MLIFSFTFIIIIYEPNMQKTKNKTKITQEYSMKMNKAHVFVKK